MHYSPVCLWFLAEPDRLACLRHAASVHPEPGSNSQKNFDASKFLQSGTEWYLAKIDNIENSTKSGDSYHFLIIIPLSGINFTPHAYRSNPAFLTNYQSALRLFYLEVKFKINVSNIYFKLIEIIFKVYKKKSPKGGLNSQFWSAMQNRTFGKKSYILNYIINQFGEMSIGIF